MNLISSLRALAARKLLQVLNLQRCAAAETAAVRSLCSEVLERNANVPELNCRSFAAHKCLACPLTGSTQAPREFNLSGFGSRSRPGFRSPKTNTKLSFSRRRAQDARAVSTASHSPTSSAKGLAPKGVPRTKRQLCCVGHLLGCLETHDKVLKLSRKADRIYCPRGT